MASKGDSLQALDRQTKSLDGEAKTGGKGKVDEDKSSADADRMDPAFREFLRQLRQLDDAGAGTGVEEQQAWERWQGLREDIRRRFRNRTETEKAIVTVQTPLRNRHGKRRRTPQDEESAAKTVKRRRRRSPPPPPPASTSCRRRPFVAFSVSEGRRMDEEAMAGGTPRASLAQKARALARRWAEMDGAERAQYGGQEEASDGD